MSTLDAQSRRLGAGIAAINALRPRIEAAAPWPRAEMYGVEAEASWGPPELLAHVDEMLPYWLGEAERIVEGSGSEPLPFGRVAADDVRIGIIGRDRTMPLRELFARLASDGDRVARRMRDLSDAEAAREGLHPTRGVVAVDALFESLVTSHLEGHVTQLEEILAARGV